MLDHVVRRLPVLQTNAEPEPPARPTWQRVAIGAGFIFAAWVPLAMLAAALVTRLMPQPSGLDERSMGAWLAAAPAAELARFWGVLIGIPALAFALAALAGGWLIGKFNARTERWDAALAGLVAASAAWALALTRMDFAIAAAALIGAGALGSSASHVGSLIARRTGEPAGQ
jgi:tRNA-(ms[2]io[6]A)-hydroxylase